MIIVKLMGGIGNQMFQYACGYNLALKYHVPLALDHSFLEEKPIPEGRTPRDYELHAFNIDLRLRQREINIRPPMEEPPQTGGWWKRLRESIGGKKYYTFFEEDTTRLDFSFFEHGKRQYLVGYFQNELYFADHQKEVRKNFTFVPIKSTANLKLAQAIKDAENPVSIHVRRGDYLTLGGGKIHGVCPLEYYAKGIDIIKTRVKRPAFFVFSADDPKWAREAFTAFGLGDSVVGDENTGAYGYENMRLMSLCKHHIIANSSFSWWGAWLNDKPDKIVIFPERWMADPRQQHFNPSPPSWMRV